MITVIREIALNCFKIRYVFLLIEMFQNSEYYHRAIYACLDVQHEKESMEEQFGKNKQNGDKKINTR